MRVPPRPSPLRLLAPVGAHRTSHRAPLLDVSRARRYEANAKTAPSKFAANFELWEQTLDARKKVYRTVNRCGASVEDACRYPCEEVRAAAPTPYQFIFSHFVSQNKVRYFVSQNKVRCSSRARRDATIPTGAFVGVRLRGSDAVPGF